MSAEYSVEEVLESARKAAASNGRAKEASMLFAYAERIKADEGAVTDEVVEHACKVMGRVKGFYPAWPEMRAALLAVWPNPPAQAAQVEDKVVVMRDGQETTEGLVLAAAIYMGAVKDIFALRSDGPPYNERKVTKDAAALRAFDHLDAATKALRSAISHYTPTAEPVAQEGPDGEDGPWAEGWDKRSGTKESPTARPRAVPDAPRTIYDQRVTMTRTVEAAAPRLYVALKNLLAAIDERPDRAGIESVTIQEAHSALLAAAPSPGESE